MKIYNSYPDCIHTFHLNNNFLGVGCFHPKKERIKIKKLKKYSGSSSPFRITEINIDSEIGSAQIDC